MTRRNGYYLPSGSKPALLQPSPEPLIGAKAIAEALGIKPQQVYRLVEGDKRRDRAVGDVPPIQRRPALGLVADRATLLAWWSRYLGAGQAA